MKKLVLSLVLPICACQGVIGAPSDTPERLAGPNARPGDPGKPGQPGAPVDPVDPADPDPPLIDPCEGAAPNPGTAPIRRLTNAEWRYTVGDLFQQPALALEMSRGFTAETESLGFRNNANFLDVPPIVAQAYLDAAEQLAERVAREQVQCDPVAAGAAACARELIERFGKRVYRRPLSAEELQRYEGLAATALRDYDFDTAVEWIVFTMLQSPSFLHRVELSAPAPGQQVVRPDPYEMASRLSYLIWRSMPDDTLFAAADRGELATPQQIEAQARRMLLDPKARRAFDFYAEWLDLDEVEAMQRDPQVFAGLPESLSRLFHDESRAFVDHVIWQENGTLETLFTAPYTFLNEELAAHYGIPDVTGPELRQVSVDPSQRSGILTQAGVVAVHDKPTRTSIVKRGLKIRTDFFCQTIGSPPDDVALELPPIDQDQTQKDRLAEHRENPRCAACHNMMDPLGVVFEQFDAVGRFRTEDEFGRTIDVTSEVEFTSDANGPISHAADLAKKLAASQQARDCFTTQIFRYSYGRAETQADSCAQKQLREKFAASGYRLQELIVSLTQTDTFLFRPAPTP